MKKKLGSIVLGLIAILLLVSCGKKSYVVTFDADNETTNEVVEVKQNNKVTKPDDPTKEGYDFVEWQLDENKYDFDSKVSKNIVLKAFWAKKQIQVIFDFNGADENLVVNVSYGEKVELIDDPVQEEMFFLGWFLDNEEFDFETEIIESITLVAKWEEDYQSLLEEDYLAIKEELMAEKYLLNMPMRGPINRSRIVWSHNSPNILRSGVIIPLDKGEEPITVEIVGTFTLGSQTHEYIFDLTISPYDEVVLTQRKERLFTNLTTEYDVKDNAIALYFEENGNVPYVKVKDFFNLIKGFIDPDLDITFTQGEAVLEIEYQYYDEEEDHIYDLILTIDLNANTLTTNDPGFYWAYVTSTETNFGRHIFYDRDNENASDIEGNDVVFELDKYNLFVSSYEGDIVLPFSLANQLFAGSSYYNVYYNYDKLFGIYSLPSSGSPDYKTIKTSSANKKAVPSDVALHNYNALAFYLDYFYGLKDFIGVENFYDFLDERKTNLLSLKADVFDEELNKIILKDFDELHTSYGNPSYYNAASWNVTPVSSLSQFGPRVKDFYNGGLYFIDGVIESKFGRAGITDTEWAANSKSRPNYWFLDDEHAVLILDGFSTADIEESSSYDASIMAKLLDVDDAGLLIPAIAFGNKFFYYKNSEIDTLLIETIVKGVDESYLETYKQNILSLGYDLTIEETAIELKKEGYYTIEKGNKTYYLVARYDTEYELFYVGIGDEDFPEKYSKDWPVSGDVEKLIESDSAVYMEFMMEAILKEKPQVTSVTLDLTWNMGGNVGALYRVLGFITKDPFIVTNINKSTNGASSSYVYIDGVPNYDYLQWSLLISPVTFSAGNAMATIFRENNLGIIMGRTSGGGAASITPILLPNGTGFTMSSNSLFGYRRGSGTEEDPYTYHHNEDGIEPDFELDRTTYFDEETILEILNNN